MFVLYCAPYPAYKAGLAGALPVKEALAEAGVEANVEKVTDISQIISHGVLGTPAVVVNGEVKSVGKIPDKEDIKKWIGG
ncbi:MAG: thioredoxin family protein [Syntrophales bacterium]|nr:thioredoxin family protein [Syntrophales bacterium]